MSNQSSTANAAEVVFADDDLVVHGYSELLTRVGNVAVHVDTLPAWVLHRLEWLSTMNGAIARHVITDHLIFAVEIECAHALDGEMRHIRAQLIGQRLT